ncbi:hypothetical protein COU56_02070 [Candidatus Pacearchaeota archaeon CG10_big_fil_rev_8_21_14_0_10_31_9]|nr:MAG: hypothetical protein COU56_02070 [Candidatus Pacearchaeota archaeon CG10_big_fil_rev_8_21_14_0_10_31_9]
MIKIPTKKDYVEFIEEFTKKISMELPTACFYTFGSINNKNCNYGRSDIGGGLILDSGIVTPKNKILRLSELFSRALNDRGILTQFNLLDRETCRDGRFLSYTTDYTDWLKDSAKVLCGPNYLGEMNGKDFKSGMLNTASFNFCGPGGVRNALLYSLVDADNNGDKFVGKVAKAIEKVAKLPKKLIWLRGGEIIQSKTEARKKLEELLEDIDLTPVDEINTLLDNPQKLYDELSNQDRAINVLAESLESMEQMVDSYLRHFPKINERELRV